MVNQDNREGIIRYLMQMADEMKKMAEGAFVPSLALMFEMAADEARDFLDRHSTPGADKKQSSIREKGDQTAAVANKAACQVEFHQGKIKLGDGDLY